MISARVFPRRSLAIAAAIRVPFGSEVFDGRHRHSLLPWSIRTNPHGRKSSSCSARPCSYSLSFPFFSTMRNWKTVRTYSTAGVLRGAAGNSTASPATVPPHSSSSSSSSSSSASSSSSSACSTSSSETETEESSLSSPRLLRGMHDYFPDQTAKYRFVERSMERVCEQYGFQEIRTPVLEMLSVFKRTLGNGSDVVSKEMYAFNDHDTMVCLRPENTASVIRAVVHRGNSTFMEKSTPTSSPLTYPDRFFYNGPMFRREKPQAGRLRQFTQFGIELINERHPHADVEAIDMARRVLQSLGLFPAFTHLQLNSLGTAREREAYKTVLRAFLEIRKMCLSVESQRRMAEGHVFRILDSKDELDKLVLAGEMEAAIAITRSRHMLGKGVLAKKEEEAAAFEADVALFYAATTTSSSTTTTNATTTTTTTTSTTTTSTTTTTTIRPPTAASFSASAPVCMSAVSAVHDGERAHYTSDRNAKAPVLSSFLGDDSRGRFHAVLEGLDRLGIPYTLDPYLIRGLDYYCHTTFEFVRNANSASAGANTLAREAATAPLGASISTMLPTDARMGSKRAPASFERGQGQSTVLAGGRYDGLDALLTGAHLAETAQGGGGGNGSSKFGIGWAAGVDRLVLLRDQVQLAVPSVAADPATVAVVVVRNKKLALTHTVRDASSSATSSSGTPSVASSSSESSPSPSSASPYALSLYALETCAALRSNGFRVVYQADTKTSAQFAFASKCAADFAVVIGDEEYLTGSLAVKDLRTGAQQGSLSMETATRAMRKSVAEIEIEGQ